MIFFSAKVVVVDYLNNHRVVFTCSRLCQTIISLLLSEHKSRSRFSNQGLHNNFCCDWILRGHCCLSACSLHTICEKRRCHNQRRPMLKQDGIIHCYRGLEHYHRHHGISSAYTDGFAAADGQVPQGHVNLALQRRLSVRLIRKLSLALAYLHPSTCFTSAVRVALLPPMLTSKDSSWDTVYPSLWM
jgi:hypothetical protein